MNRRSTTHGSTTYERTVSTFHSDRRLVAQKLPVSFFIRKLFKDNLRIQMNMIHMNRRSTTRGSTTNCSMKLRTYVRTYQLVDVHPCLWFSLFFVAPIDSSQAFLGFPKVFSGFQRKNNQMNMIHINRRSTTRGSTTYSVHTSQ